MQELDERLSKGARVAQVAPRDDDPIGNLPAQALQNPVHDRLLTFQAKRIHRVHQVNAQPIGHLTNAEHGIIEIALDLDRQGAMVEALGQLSIGDLSRTDKNDRPESELRCRAINRQGRRSVAGAGAGDPPRTHHSRMSECGGHAVVFEASRRIHAFVLQQQVAGGHADILPDLVGLLEQGLSFAYGDHHVRGREGQEIAKSPDAGEVQGFEAVSPLGLEIGKPSRNRQAVPVVNHVNHITTGRA